MCLPKAGSDKANVGLYIQLPPGIGAGDVLIVIVFVLKQPVGKV
jgi:hypothetical protein